MSLSNFKKLTPEAEKIAVTIDGKPTLLSSGNLAAAMLEAGIQTFRRSPVSNTPRAPYCCMGVCFECLVEINGVPNLQACLQEVSEGMNIQTHSAIDA